MDTTARTYRLGLDLGANSLGWFVVWLDGKGEPAELGPGGVRIYPDGRDPQSKTSNAVARRVARGARRRRDRYLRRRSRLMDLLAGHGLMPAKESERKALAGLDPYELRARALDEKLEAHHVGRALFHLNQRRGFLSNRKTEAKDTEAGAIKTATGQLGILMREADARTLGEFLAARHGNREPVRARNRSTGPKAEYEFYPARQMLQGEFDAIWSAQALHHPNMTDAARDAIRNEIFYQRPLRTPPVGKCSLDPPSSADDIEGFRCARAHPLAQRFRIWQEVRNLAVQQAGKTETPLTKDEGDKIALALLQNNKVTFDRMRTLLGLPPEARFNLENEKRKELKGDETAAKLSHKDLFHKAWRAFAPDRQCTIVERLLNETDEEKLVGWLQSETSLDEHRARAVSAALLPDGHARLGLRAIRNILPHMEAGLAYPDAAKAASYDHALLPDGEVSANGRLPYYGEWLQNDVLGTGDPCDGREKRWGRFPNPTVHIGLNQLRRIVNALIREIGHPPTEISVEMTRAFKLSPREMSELEREQAQNQRCNEERRNQLRDLGQPENARNILKLRLWEELNPLDPLDRRCPFSGETIGIQRLLSEDVEIEHLIPFSKSWDDSAANKVVCVRGANRLKGQYTPFEAFGGTPQWDEIAARAEGLPKNKRWRFAPDAQQRFDAMGGFLARQLNETGWLARSAKRYLAAVTDPYKITVLPGKLTALVRAKWGFNTLLPDHNFSDGKNRKDYRHHAIDALVVALTDCSLLQRMASANSDEGRSRIDVPPPWPTLRDDLDRRLRTMTVSHKPDHGIAARLHEDTAYGAVRDPAAEDGANIVYRKGFLGLNEREIGRIRDRRLRALVETHVESERAAGKDLKSALQSFAARTDIPGLPNGIRHVRLTKVEKPEYLVSIADANGKPYKAYSAGENAYVEIFRTSDGRWRGEAVSVFAANRNATVRWPSEHPDATFIMRVYKGDLLALERDGKRTIMLVRQLDASANRFKLAPHNEAGDLQKRHDDAVDPFRWLMASYSTLQSMNAERVRVDEIGRVWRVH